jgi:hypothetical protein
MRSILIALLIISLQKKRRIIKKIFEDIYLPNLIEKLREEDLTKSQETLEHLINLALEFDSSLALLQLKNIELLDVNKAIHYKGPYNHPLPLLHIACAYAKNSIAEFLLENGAIHDQKLPPLMRAKVHTEEEIKELRTSERPILIQTFDTPLDIAERTDNKFLIDLLVAIETSKEKPYHSFSGYCKMMETPSWMTEVTVRGFHEDLPKICAGESSHKDVFEPLAPRENGSMSPFSG